VSDKTRDQFAREVLQRALVLLQELPKNPQVKRIESSEHSSTLHQTTVEVSIGKTDVTVTLWERPKSGPL
jgi:hypothetical protein